MRIDDTTRIRGFQSRNCYTTTVQRRPTMVMFIRFPDGNRTLGSGLRVDLQTRYFYLHVDQDVELCLLVWSILQVQGRAPTRYIEVDYHEVRGEKIWICSPRLVNHDQTPLLWFFYLQVWPYWSVNQPPRVQKVQQIVIYCLLQRSVPYFVDVTRCTAQAWWPFVVASLIGTTSVPCCVLNIGDCKEDSHHCFQRTLVVSPWWWREQR